MIWGDREPLHCPYCEDVMPSYRCPKPRCRRVYAYFHQYGPDGARRFVGWARPSPVYGLAELVEFLARMAAPTRSDDLEFSKRYAHRRGVKS